MRLTTVLLPQERIAEMTDELRGYIKALEDQIAYHKKLIPEYQRGEMMSIAESVHGQNFHEQSVRRLEKLLEHKKESL
jgi:hypothetical protein